MRDLKFRAWLTLSDYDDDGNDKDFHGMATKISVSHSGDIGFSLDEGQHIFGSEVFERALDNETAYEYEEWCHWDGRFELMQYTGLKDVEGVEIYEHDIIQWQDGRPKEYISLVEWSDRSLWWALTDSHVFVESLGRAELPKVIGNKWENPELLVK